MPEEVNTHIYKLIIIDFYVYFRKFFNFRKIYICRFFEYHIASNPKQMIVLETLNKS